jgi:hypothetical protein
VWLIVAYLPTPKPAPTPSFGYPASAVSPSAHPLPQNKQIVSQMAENNKGEGEYLFANG